MTCGTAGIFLLECCSLSVYLCFSFSVCLSICLCLSLSLFLSLSLTLFMVMNCYWTNLLSFLARITKKWKTIRQKRQWQKQQRRSSNNSKSTQKARRFLSTFVNITFFSTCFSQFCGNSVANSMVRRWLRYSLTREGNSTRFPYDNSRAFVFD